MLNETDAHDDDTFTLRTAAAALSCGVHSVRLALADGRLRGFRINGRGDWRTTRRWLIEFAEAEAQKAESLAAERRARAALVPRAPRRDVQ
jgi:hypothetical protein